MVASRSLMLWAAAPLVALAACSTSDDASPPPIANDAGPGDAAAPPDAPPTDAGPYPSGPYGARIGDTLTDLAALGYRLSRTARDATILPYEPIHLSEVRAANPACTCFVVLVSTAGRRCGPCRDAEQTLATAVLADESLCVLEILDHNFDAAQPDVAMTGMTTVPTRADLDATVASSRQPFPVGIRTDSSLDGLALRWLPFFPIQYVARTSDMKIADLVVGSSGHDGLGLVKTIKSTCETPREPVQTILAGVEPRAMIHAGGALFVATRDRGVVRLAHDGSAATTLMPKGPSTPLALVADTTHVYWATGEGTAPFVLARAPVAGGATETLSAADAGYTSVSPDDINVYFTRSDGVVAWMPKSGGTTTIITTGEDKPRSVVVDELRAYWLAGAGDVRTVAKGGGAPTTLVAASAFPAPSPAPVELVTYRERLIARTAKLDGLGFGAFYAVSKTDGATTVFHAPIGNPIATAFAGEEIAVVAGNPHGASFPSVAFIGKEQSDTFFGAGHMRVNAVAWAPPYLYGATGGADGSIWRIRR